MSRTWWFVPAALAAASAVSCYDRVPSKGGGQIAKTDAKRAAKKPPDPSGIAVPPGYRIELVAEKLTFPTGVTFGAGGEVYVVESGYSIGDVVATPRILEITDGAEPRVVHAGKSHAPWNGITFHDGHFYVAQGGQKEGGRVVRISKDGEVDVLVDQLPSQGDHHTNGPIVTDDGWVYFGQGTVTNSAVVGVDSDSFGWLKSNPTLHDTPCADVTLTGVNFESANPLTEADDKVTTGAYRPFGTPSKAGEVVRGKVPCSGAVMRVRTDGGEPELVAWGLRNPYGLALAADGTLYVSDNGYDVRGSRPVFGSADWLWRVDRVGGAAQWFGWPDFAEGRPLTFDAYAESDGDPKGFVLAEHPRTPPEPVARFAVHASADGLDIARSDAFGYPGQAFVAEFGDMSPDVGKVVSPVGFDVVRVDLETGAIEQFARNEGEQLGPASRIGGRGLERPIAVRFEPGERALYVVDFGILRMTDQGPDPEPGTGRLWRIVKEDADEAR
jgi:glucose/arabinose dehydrogenase